MKAMVCCFFMVLLILASTPAQAKEPFVLYDDFNSEFLDLAKWSGTERRDSGITILEYVRELHGGRLHMKGRAFGSMDPVQGTRAGDVNSVFGYMTQFKTLQVSVKVNDVEVTGCPGFNLTPTSSRARLLGFFFKAGPGTGRIDDVLAQIRIQRASDSLDRSGVVQVFGDIVVCSNSDCSSGQTIASEMLGKLMLGQWADIQINWDKRNKNFMFKLNRQPLVVLSYGSVPDYDPPSSPYQAVGVSNRIANCPDQYGGKKMGFIEAEFEDLFVINLNP